MKKIIVFIFFILLLVINSTPNAFSKNSSHTILTAQQILKEKGYDPGKPDGIFGGMTRSALKKYQNDSNVSVTGELDKDTLRTLGINVNNDAEVSLYSLPEEWNELPVACKRGGGKTTDKVPYLVWYKNGTGHPCTVNNFSLFFNNKKGKVKWFKGKKENQAGLIYQGDESSAKFLFTKEETVNGTVPIDLSGSEPLQDAIHNTPADILKTISVIELTDVYLGSSEEIKTNATRGVLPAMLVNIIQNTCNGPQ